MNTRFSVPMAIAAISLGTAALAQQPDQQQPQPGQQSQQGQQPQQLGGRQFLMQAIQGDLAEIALGELAQQKGESDEVREYGEKLVQDHSRSLEEARQLAEAEGIEVPEEPSPEAQQMHEQLTQLSGDEFDREFIRHMVEDHEKAIGLFETQTEGSDTETAEYAEETLPVLEEHLQIAESIDPGGRG